MKNSLDKNAKWLLLFGILLTFLFPLLLPLLNKTGIGNFGVVGDAIGGITNPISQLIGSILLYLALKAQLSANGIVQNQIEKDNIKEEQQHNTEQIRTFYSFFQETIKNFSYEFSDANGKQLLYGKRAIKCFLNDLEQMKVDIHNTDDVLMYDGVRELLSILKSAEELFNRIDTISSKSQHIYFIELFCNTNYYSIFFLIKTLMTILILKLENALFVQMHIHIILLLYLIKLNF